MAAEKTVTPPDLATEWVTFVATERHRSNLLQRGNWRGFYNDHDTQVMRGRYVLVRDESPQLMVAHSDADTAFKLALFLEAALADWPTPRVLTKRSDRSERAHRLGSSPPA